MTLEPPSSPVLEAICGRRSIRRFSPAPIPRHCLEAILEAGRLAPSSNNRQPWRFAVITEESRAAFLTAFAQGIALTERGGGMFPEQAAKCKAAAHTVEVLRQAPVTVLVLNPFGFEIGCPLTPEEHLVELGNAQSIGAALENMALAAYAFGLGSLWIGDIHCAYRAIQDFLQTGEQLVAAMAFGYPEEHPPARPRKKPEDCIRWL